MSGVLVMIKLWGSKSIYVLKCKNSTGKWIELDELEEKISSRDAKDRYEEEIEANGCTKLKLEEYKLVDGDNRKYVKKHWHATIGRPKQLDVEDVLGATAFNFLKALESCQKLQSFIQGFAGSGSEDELFRIIEMVMRMQQLRQQQPIQQPPAQQPQPQPEVDEEEVERLKAVARQLLEQQAKEFSMIDETKAPCLKNPDKCPNKGGK